MTTPGEIEVARRNLLAELKAAVGDVNDEIRLDRQSWRDLIEVLEALNPAPAQPDVAGALAIASDCAMYDGDHHKMWVIDQMVRHLTGCPTVVITVPPRNGVDGYSYNALGESEAYRAFVGDDEDDWDTGIAP